MGFCSSSSIQTCSGKRKRRRRSNMLLQRKRRRRTKRQAWRKKTKRKAGAYRRLSASSTSLTSACSLPWIGRLTRQRRSRCSAAVSCRPIWPHAPPASYPFLSLANPKACGCPWRHFQSCTGCSWTASLGSLPMWSASWIQASPRWNRSEPLDLRAHEGGVGDEGKPGGRTQPPIQ
eukprot:UN5056